MKLLITGGAGFIGINTAEYFLKKGHAVTIFDNFSRKGSVKNIAWLKKQKYETLKVVSGDIRHDVTSLGQNTKDCDVIIHLAGQVAVTSSVLDPMTDSEINITGTLHVLEAARKAKKPPIVLYSSTNKVYGALEDVGIKEDVSRYRFTDLPHGVSEEQPLDFHSPYGCSKGAADQYVRDYYRIYNLPTVVFRQSCIYGAHQHGVEDQGWIAWFMIALAQHKNLTIYGNGKQVRDVLYVDDLVRAYDMAIQKIHKTKGQIYNIGGGMENTLSIWYEFYPILESVFHHKIHATFSAQRPGDQPIYVSDIRKAERDFGWKPTTPISKGMQLIADWIQANYAIHRPRS